MKKVTGYKQQIHRILADTHNDPAECFPDFILPLVTPWAASVRHCTKMYICKMNKSHANLSFYNIFDICGLLCSFNAPTILISVKL